MVVQLRKNCATTSPRPLAAGPSGGVVDCRPNPFRNSIAMLPPKAFLDALSHQASRLFGGESPLPRAELEAQFKVLLQSAFGKLDLVSRDEFDSQMVVLARTRARLEALEAKVAEMEAKLTPPAEAE